MSRNRSATLPAIDIRLVPRIILGSNESSNYYADDNRDDDSTAEGDDEDSIGFNVRHPVARPRSFRHPTRPKNAGPKDVSSRRGPGMSSTPQSREPSPGRAAASAGGQRQPSLRQVPASFRAGYNRTTNRADEEEATPLKARDEHGPGRDGVPGSGGRVAPSKTNGTEQRRNAVGEDQEMRINRPDHLGFSAIIPSALPSHMLSGTIAPAPSPAGTGGGAGGRGGAFTFGNRLIVPFAEANHNAVASSTIATNASGGTTSPTGNKGPPKSPKSPTGSSNQKTGAGSKTMFPMPPPIGEDTEITLGDSADPSNPSIERSASFSERVRRFESTRSGAVVNRGDAIRRGSGPVEPTPKGLHRLTKLALGMGYGGGPAGGSTGGSGPGLPRYSPNRSPTGQGSVSASTNASASGSARGSGNILQLQAQAAANQPSPSALVLSKIEVERQDSTAFYVQVLGGEGVGKSSLCMQLQTSEYVGDRDPGERVLLYCRFGHSVQTARMYIRVRTCVHSRVYSVRFNFKSMFLRANSETRPRLMADMQNRREDRILIFPKILSIFAHMRGALIVNQFLICCKLSIRRAVSVMRQALDSMRIYYF